MKKIKIIKAIKNGITEMKNIISNISDCLRSAWEVPFILGTAKYLFTYGDK